MTDDKTETRPFPTGEELSAAIVDAFENLRGAIGNIPACLGQFGGATQSDGSEPEPSVRKVNFKQKATNRRRNKAARASRKQR